MNLYDGLLSKQESLSLIGLGYVGLPIAVAFSRHVNVVGFDVSSKKIDKYMQGIDPTKEVGDQVVADCQVHFTSDENHLKKCKFHIVAVPTPIKRDKTPDLSPLENASILLGCNLVKGSIVVYESTVYPGVTEDICVPILERESGLVCGVDFKIGYSPERINPGDKVHRLETIIKIVSGMDTEALECIAKVYELVVEAGVYRASSIKVAEAAKVIENSQRDINIAFMNELSIIFNKMGIDTQEVLNAACTKWNFLNFSPGLVGGHCIGVDPYYLTYKAERLGYQSQIILAGRRLNDGMGSYVAQQTVKKLIAAGLRVQSSRVGILGFTFKENCPDTRNTKVIDIVDELREFGIAPIICDPESDSEDTEKEYDIKLVPMHELNSLDALIIAVAHTSFSKLSPKEIHSMLKKDSKVIIDIKGILTPDDYKDCIYWRL